MQITEDPPPSPESNTKSLSEPQLRVICVFVIQIS